MTKIMTMLDTLTFTFTDVTGRLATSKEIITQTFNLIVQYYKASPLLYH